MSSILPLPAALTIFLNVPIALNGRLISSTQPAIWLLHTPYWARCNRTIYIVLPRKKKHVLVFLGLECNYPITSRAHRARVCIPKFHTWVQRNKREGESTHPNVINQRVKIHYLHHPS